MAAFGHQPKTIDGATTFVLSLQQQTVTVRSDATNWLVGAVMRVKTGDIDASAITPVTCGVAIDVPLNVEYVPAGVVL